MLRSPQSFVRDMMKRDAELFDERSQHGVIANHRFDLGRIITPRCAQQQIA